MCVSAAGSGRRAASRRVAGRSAEQRHHQQCNDVDDLDQRVDRRTGGILVRIADGVARDSRLVRIRALAAAIAVLDILLRVVPGAATGGHRDGDKQARDDCAEQEAAERLGTEQQTHDERHQDRQQARNDHFLDRGTGQQVDRTAVIRLAGAIHDALDLPELPADLVDHRAGGATDGLHRHGAEQVGYEAAEEKADDDEVVVELEHRVDTDLVEGIGVVGE